MAPVTSRTFFFIHCGSIRPCSRFSITNWAFVQGLDIASRPGVSTKAPVSLVTTMHTENSKPPAVNSGATSDKTLNKDTEEFAPMSTIDGEVVQFGRGLR